MILKWPMAGSLRLRLAAITLVTLSLALAGSYVLLTDLFRNHVLGQLDVTLAQQLDQLTAQLEFDATGTPQLNTSALLDPRWTKPYSGLYWQIDRLKQDGHLERGVLRSRSLWDTDLALPADALAGGSMHTHELSGPKGETLRVAERSLTTGQTGPTQWRMAVATDLIGTQAAMQRFNQLLALSLAGLGLLLMLAAWAQVRVGLAPLQSVQGALLAVREGRAQRLEGQSPTEIQPLINDFNGVLDRNAEILARARTQAGNLAHALKTPLAVLANAAHNASDTELRQLVAEQVPVAQRHIHWHLVRARAAATTDLPGQRTPVEPLLQGLIRVMGKVHASSPLQVHVTQAVPDAVFAGEAQDLQEMLGNVLDNAWRHAHQRVDIVLTVEPTGLCITVDDDGPGIEPSERAKVLQRGVRLDESQPGSGLGLAIVQDLARLYGGNVDLGASPSHGLRVRLTLPSSNSATKP